MPAIMVETVKFDDARGTLCISLNELAERLPYLKVSGEIEFYIAEIRDELDRLVKRFKPFAKLQLKVESYGMVPSSSLRYAFRKRKHLCLILQTITELLS